MPNVGEAWITWLFKFQQGANGLRDLKFQLLPGPWMSPSHPQETYAANAARLNTLLEDMLKQGTEEFQQRVLGNKQ